MTETTTNQDLIELKRRMLEIESLRAASSLMQWDQLTLMPEQGASHRGDHLALIEKFAHEKSVDPEVGRLLEKLVAQAPTDAVDVDLVRVATEDFEKRVRLPADFVARQAAHAMQCYTIWKKARAAKDFTAVVEPLKKTLDLSREYSNYFKRVAHIADPLIDANDPSSTVASIRPLFAKLRTRLVPLFEKIVEQGPFDQSCLLQSFDEEKQLAFGKKVIERIGYDFARGRQDKTAHPFMIRFSTGDIRITTRVKPNDLSEALFSSIHEAGHALYELGVDPQLEGTPLASGTSAGVHESQSRLWENIVGRSLSFWTYFYPELQKTFPDQLGRISLADFHRAINRVSPSLIRTDADEVSYNLHVMIRFDLELELLEGRLKVEDLRDAWNARYQSDLGVTPPHDGDGVLQDVHWYSGLIGGTFQGYTLGNIMSAQFFEAANQTHPELTTQIAQGDFQTLREWLRKNIHHFGRRHSAIEAVRFATGRALEIEPYVNYLENKFQNLTRIQK